MIILQSGFIPYDSAAMLQESQDILLQESDDYILIDSTVPLTHARIVHSRNWAAGGTASASSVADSYFVAGPLNSLTYERWRAASTSQQSWVYEHPTDFRADCLSIAAHNFTGAKLRVQYVNESAWVDLIPETQIASNAPIMAFFNPVVGQQFRIVLRDSLTPPEMGACRVAASLAMQRPIYGGHSPVDLARMTELRSNISDTGEFLGRTVKRNYLSTSYKWTNLSAQWIRSRWPDLQRGIEAEPFWLAWRPASFSVAAYGQTDQTPIPSNMGVRDLMEVSLSMRAFSHD